MSLHRSLKTKSAALDAHRNVLTRAERIARLRDEGAFDDEENSPIGLPKVRNIMVVTAKKKKATEEDGEEGTETEIVTPAE